MKKTVLAVAIASTMASSGNLMAASLEDRLMAMEKRINYLEQRVQSQDQVIQDKDAELRELKGGSDTPWFQKVGIGGAIEVEANSVSTDGSPDTSDVVAATVELGITAQVNDWVSAEFVAKYSEDTDNADADSDNDFNVDTAMVAIANPDANWFVNAGHYTMPFGAYSTNMLADPLTLNMGETGDTAIEVGIDNDGLGASIYIFQGDNETETNSFGAQITYSTEGENFSFTGHLGYINNIGETDGISGDSNETAGWVVSAELTTGPFTVIGEYITASDNVSALGNAEPSAYNLEVGYGFDVAGMPATIALGVQGTDEASHSGVDLAEERVIGAFTLEIQEGTTVGLEFINDEAYDGTETDTVTGKLAVEF
ncbi:MAG: LbtU family siderophore porin [Sedimenticola sp.]